MDERIYYHGSDGHIKQLGDQELQHYKYIKKIGNRYFYTPEELKAYYNDQQDKVKREEAFGGNAKDIQRAKDRRERDAFNKKVDKDLKKAARETGYVDRDKEGNLRFRDPTKKEIKEKYKKIDRQAKRRDTVNRLIDRLSDTASSAEKKTRAARNTIKMAAQGKEKPKETKSKYSQEDIDRIRRESWARKVKQDEARKKRKKKEEARRQYSPASRW